MKQQTGQKTLNDFGAFDSTKDDLLFEIWRKDKPEIVFVFAHVFFDARAIALSYFRDDSNQPLGYDGVSGEQVDEGKATFAEGTVFLKKDPSLGALVFEVTRTTDSKGARRGEGLRKRKPVALQGRRQDTPVSSGVQAHRQDADHGEAGGTPQAEGRGAQSGAYTNGAARDPKGALDHGPDGSVPGAGGESR